MDKLGVESLQKCRLSMDSHSETLSLCLNYVEQGQMGSRRGRVFVCMNLKIFHLKRSFDETEIGDISEEM